MSESIQLLIVDNDPVTEFLFRDHLPANVQLHFTTSPQKAAELLTEKPFDFLICSLHMPRVSGLELGAWAKLNHAQLELIILTSRRTSKDLENAEAMGASHVFKKPLNFKELNLLFKGRSKGVQGYFRQVNLADLLQVVSMNNKGLRLFSVKNVETDQQGYIYLRDQNVVHSEFRSISYGSTTEGPDAFFKLLSFSNAQMTEVEWVGKEDYKHTIDLPLQTLLVEATKHMDETQQTVAIRELKRILVVEDDPQILEMLSRFLESQNYEVETSESAILGAKMMKEQPFDLVITDINMPEITGVVFLSWIKSHFPECPVIIMTAFHDPELEEASQKIGCLKFMQKPFSLKLFHKYLESLVSQGIEGEIQYIQMLDLIQLELLTRNQKCLKVTDLKNHQKAAVYIDNGRLIHAEYGDLVGEEAFYKIADIHKGEFKEERWQEPSEHSLGEIPPHRLLMKAGGQITETEIQIDPAILARIEKKLKF